MSNEIINSDVTVNMIPKIAVFGVGGAGINAVNNMILSQLDGIKFVAANTDRQNLNNSLAEVKIQLGVKCTKGLGAGSNPEIGRQSAEEACEVIKRELADMDMLFIATGMGGGTGTGASPVIAKIARDMGILTIAIAIKPFLMEGKKRMLAAEDGISKLEQIVDTLIVIENQKLMELNNATMFDNYAIADSILRQSVYCVVSILSKQGFINRDFADIKTVLSSSGRAVIGYGEDIDAGIATDFAIHNHVLENDSICGAKNILVNISGSRNIKPSDIESIVNKIRDEAKDDGNEEPNVIFGIILDEELGNKIHVSVIASGVNTKKKQKEIAIESNNKNEYNRNTFTENKHELVETVKNINNKEEIKKEITDNSVTETENITTNVRNNTNVSDDSNYLLNSKEELCDVQNLQRKEIKTENTFTHYEDLNNKDCCQITENDANKNNDNENKKVDAPVFASPLNEDDLENDESFSLKVEDFSRADKNIIPFQNNNNFSKSNEIDSYEINNFRKNILQSKQYHETYKQNVKQDNHEDSFLQFGLFDNKNQQQQKKHKNFLSKIINSIGQVPEIDTINNLNTFDDQESEDEYDIYDTPTIKRKIS